MNETIQGIDEAVAQAQAHGIRAAREQGVADFVSRATTIRVVEYDAYRHATWEGLTGRLFAWPSRFWHGAWLTLSGFIIRSWTDDVHMEKVREARKGGA